MIMEHLETLTMIFGGHVRIMMLVMDGQQLLEMEALRIILIKSMFQELGLRIILILNPY